MAGMNFVQERGQGLRGLTYSIPKKEQKSLSHES